MKKRVLSLFMALALCLTLLPTAALAEEAGAAPDAANADSTYTNGEDAGLAGGEDDSAPDDTDGGDTGSSGEMQGGEADTAVSAVQGASHASHCVCGGNGDVKGHTHNTDTTWTAATSLPGTAGSYYLTQSVSGDWTVPTGGVNLCLNGQTISGSIKVGSGATLTLTDCSDSGRVQGSGSGSGVSINGGTFNLYEGTITGFVNGVEIGSHNDIKTGSSFTMYGGAITDNKAGSASGGGVFLIGTTNSNVTAPSFTMHGGTISNNTAGASDGGGGGVYVGQKCSFTMDGGTITGNTATDGNGGGIYIHFNAGSVSISNATITDNKASATGNTSYGHGGGIYSQRGVTVKNVTITGNNSTYEGGGIYGKGAITLTDATVTDNSQYDVYYDGKETTTPELTVSGSVKAGYYANFDWKLPILVSGALSEDSVIRVGVREGIKPNAGGSLLIAEPASGVTLSAENFKADAADCVTSLGEDGKVYLVPCTHEMDDTGYTCKKCHTQFDARVGESAYYQTLTKAFDAARGNTVTLLRDVTLTENCSSSYTYSATLDLNGKTVSSERYYISVGGGNNPRTLTVMNSGTGGGTQALDVTFYVSSNGTLAVDDSYTGKISRVELQAGGTLERFGGKIGELVLSNAAYGSTSTGYGLKLWKGNANACTIGKFTDNNKSKSLTVNDLLKTNHAKCELYGEKGGTWSIVDKSTKIVDLTGYTAYKVQFPECVHQCADDSNPVCSVCHKKLYTKITAKAADGTTKTAYFTEDSALENGYVEAIQTLNGWSNGGCTEPTLTLLRDMYAFGTSMPLTGTLTLEGGTHTAKNVTVAKNANVTFASGSYSGATIDGTATVKEGVTFTSTVTVNGTLNAKGGTFNGPVEFKGSSIANISGGSFNSEKKYGGVTFDYNVTGTISGGTFVFADFYTTKVKLSGGTFTIIKTNGDRKLADLLAEGAAYYGASDNQAVTNDSVNTLENVKVVSHTHNGGTDGKGTCSICGKQMAASLTVGGKTSWYTAFASAIEAANAADGEKTITLYQDVNGYADGNSTTYELTRGPVTLATGGKSVTRANLTVKDISLTVTGSNGGFNVTVDGKGAELTVNDGNTELAIVTAQNGGKLSLRNGTFSRVAVKDDGSSASLSGGSYDEITSDAGYVKPYALLAKGYAYKKTTDNKWLPNANSIPSKVTVEKAPFVVEKIYPNSDTNYTGNSAFATDGNITLTAVIASEPETENVTYYYWWELFDESKKDWTTTFSNVNTATHDGKQSKTLSISNLPENSIYQYRVDVRSDNGYQCYSEPFTVTRHQHSWAYTASGATITAKCSQCSASGGSVTIAAPAELTYNGSSKVAVVTASGDDWQGPAVSDISIGYIKTGKYGPEKLENDALPTNAGTYTASITLGKATASVEYTIEKATLTVTPNSGQSKSYGTTPDPVLAYTSTGTVTGETAAFDGALSREAGEDVGTYNITKGSLALEDSSTFKATNYNLVLDTAVVTFEITKGTYGGSAPTKTVNILKNYAGVQTGTLTAADFFTTAPAEAKITNAVPNADSSNMMSIAGADSSGNFTYDSKTNITAASDESWTVTISSKNYTDITGTLTFKLVDKTDVSAQITFPNGTLTYNGAGQKYEKATTSTTAAGTPVWTYIYAPADATASLDSAGLPKTAGTYTVTAKYEDDTHIGTKSATLTVSKATPTGAPTCTKITTSGKTLADAPLAIGTIAPAGGTLAWDMAATTVVAANTAYGWTYTPADTANYKALTGSLTPYAVSSGGGGGGGGSAATPPASDKAAKELKNAKEGSTVTIDMKGETKLPASVTKEIAGKDVTVELDMGGGMVWSFSGLDVPKGGVSLDLGVKTGTKTIPAKVIHALTGEVTTVQLQLNHNGPFGMSLKLSVDLGKKHDGLYANLYFYNPKISALEFQSASMISGGKASWAFDHASDYAIVIDKESHEPTTFIDVPDSAYYAEAVDWAVAKKITGGIGNKLFGPNDPCTRAQIVTFLWRAAGSPEPKAMSTFVDVSADAYYAKAVAWAVENGITGGTGDGKFSPDAACTRAQAVTFLWRANGSPAVSGNAAFRDVAANAYYAAAVTWAEKNGITGGIGGGLFGSDHNCTRAQIVTFLYRSYQSK